MTNSTGHSPRLSIGMPVRNGEATLSTALDSLLGQTFNDFEIVVVDNASTDRTREICLEYVQRDHRVRYHRNETNIGQIANFNRAFELSRGEYFRWTGCNDWWETSYFERCVETLDQCPPAVLVTCYQAHYDTEGNRYFKEYTGPRVDSTKAFRRFARLLWFLRRSRYLIDPIYSMMRREALTRTHLLPFMLGTDLVLASELSLVGPWCHVPECLAYRRITPKVPKAELARRFDPRQRATRMSQLKICLAIRARIAAQPLSVWTKWACYLILVHHFVCKKARGGWRIMRRLVGKLIRFQAIKAFVRNQTTIKANN